MMSLDAMRTWRWEWLAITLTASMLASALIMEHVMGLVPCPLCLMQRVWMVFVGAVAVAGLTHGRNIGIYPLFGVLTAGIGGSFSIRHLYLQTLPPGEAPSCGPDLGYMFSNFPLADVLTAMTHGTGECAKVDSIIDVLIPLGALAGFILLVVICARGLLIRAT